jgi:hypothetical protein
MARKLEMTNVPEYVILLELVLHHVKATNVFLSILFNFLEKYR